MATTNKATVSLSVSLDIKRYLDGLKAEGWNLSAWLENLIRDRIKKDIKQGAKAK